MFSECPGKGKSDKKPQHAKQGQHLHDKSRKDKSIQKSYCHGVPGLRLEAIAGSLEAMASRSSNKSEWVKNRSPT